MLVSVIMCVWNGEQTIRESLCSVLNQTFRDFELIVIDDGSTDGSMAAIADNGDQRIKRFSFENAGPAVARNRGIHQSSGNFITFMDADDVWLTQKLERQLKALQRHPEASVAYCWVDRFECDVRVRQPHAYGTLSGNVYERLLVGNLVGNGSNILVRREALEEVGLFHESLLAAEDWELNLRLAARHKFIAVQEALVLYRQTPGSITSDLERMERGVQLAIQKVFREAPVELRYLMHQREANFYDFMASRICRGVRSRQQAWYALHNLLRIGLRYKLSEWNRGRLKRYLGRVGHIIQRVSSLHQ